MYKPATTKQQTRERESIYSTIKDYQSHTHLYSSTLTSIRERKLVYRPTSSRFSTTPKPSTKPLQSPIRIHKHTQYVGTSNGRSVSRRDTSPACRRHDRPRTRRPSSAFTRSIRFGTTGRSSKYRKQQSPFSSRVRPHINPIQLRHHIRSIGNHRIYRSSPQSSSIRL